MQQLLIRYNNRLLPVQVAQCDTIQSIRTKLNLAPNIRLFTHKRLRDKHTIEYYGITPNTTIQAVGGLLGGFPITKPADTAVETSVQTGNFLTNFFQKVASWIKDMAHKIKTFAFKVKDQIIRRLQFVKTILTWQKFFPIILLVLIILAFFGKPLEYIMLFVAIIAVSILYVIYSILNLPPFIYIIGMMYFSIFEIIPFLIYCIVFGAFFVIIFLVCFIIAILNAITGGALTNLVLCQNSPGSWYKTANYHLGNKWERGFMCAKPCSSRHYPDATGLNCKAVPRGNPAYCPQAEIMRIYARKQADRKHMFANYQDTMNLKYLTSKPEERERMLKDHYMRKRDFLNTCSDKMRDFDYIALNICGSADSLEASKYLSPSDVKKLKQVCHQAYCTSKKNYPFCSKMSNLNENEEDALLKKILKIIILITVFVIIFVSTMNYMYGDFSLTRGDFSLTSGDFSLTRGNNNSAVVS